MALLLLLVHFSAGFRRAKDPTLPSNMKFLLVVAFIGSAKAIETVGLHQQTPVQYGSQIGPVLYGALGEGGLVSESRTLPDEAGPKMSALPMSGLATVPKILKPAQHLVYRPNPYVYIPAIGQVAKPEETVGNVEPRTVPEGLKPVATNPFVYIASPYVYAHHMNPVHPNQITPIVPHGLAYSFTSGHANVIKVPKPEETLVNAELRTVAEGVNPVATNPFVYNASPYVYAHPMNSMHPTQITPIVPHGFAYSFTTGNQNVPAQPKDIVSVEKREADAYPPRKEWKENYGHPSYYGLPRWYR